MCIFILEYRNSYKTKSILFVAKLFFFLSFFLFLSIHLKISINYFISINILFQTLVLDIFNKCFIAVQLLHKYSVRASDGPMKLLKVIKNPVSDHLPVGCRKILMSFNANKVINPREIVPPEDPITIVVGAMAHGQVIFILAKYC